MNESEGMPQPAGHAAPAEIGPQEAAGRFAAPDLRSSLWQCASTLAALLALSGAMYEGLAWGVWPVLALGLPAAGLVVRIFILQHDCGHGAFFRARWANSLVGWACSVITLAPYANWRRQHAQHHATWNDLDQRHRGADFYSGCTTVDEYLAMSPRQRLGFRILRHPLVANLIIPPLLFIVLYRLPFDSPRSWRKERRGVHLTNLAVVGLYAALGWWLGFAQVAIVSLAIVIPASIAGVWLFSVQHRFQGAVWLPRERWTPVRASLEGSIFLELPAVLRWFTGSIGYHHVHHLAPRVPNYRLAACHAAYPGFRAVPALHLRAALRAWRLTLWDAAAGCLVSCAAARAAARG